MEIFPSFALDGNKEEKPVFVQANSNSGQGHVLLFIPRALETYLACQHFVSDWLGKLKPNKFSTGCQNELKLAAVEKTTNPGGQLILLSRPRRSFERALRAFLRLHRSVVPPTKPPC